MQTELKLWSFVTGVAIFQSKLLHFLRNLDANTKDPYENISHRASMDQTGICNEKTKKKCFKSQMLELWLGKYLNLLLNV